MQVKKIMHLIKEICRILILMAKILILIIALNAFITPVSAIGVCEMMEDVEMSSSSMAIMDCSECEDANCASLQCGMNSSAATTPALFSEKQLLNIVAGNHRPQADLAYFYKIVLPINTPPPLV